MLAGMALWFRIEPAATPVEPDPAPAVEAPAPAKPVRKTARMEKTVPAADRAATGQAAPSAKAEPVAPVPPPQAEVSPASAQEGEVPMKMPARKPVVEEITLAEAEPTPSLELTETTSKRVVRGIGSFFKPRREKP
jgi:hypothetical protein